LDHLLSKDSIPLENPGLRRPPGRQEGHIGSIPHPPIDPGRTPAPPGGLSDAPYRTAPYGKPCRVSSHCVSSRLVSSYGWGATRRDVCHRPNLIGSDDPSRAGRGAGPCDRHTRRHDLTPWPSQVRSAAGARPRVGPHGVSVWVPCQFGGQSHTNHTPAWNPGGGAHRLRRAGLRPVSGISTGGWGPRLGLVRQLTATRRGI
jgi:hypothetical protein